MNYSRGEIVWVKFPFSDSSTTKLRPALIISNSDVNRTGDYLLMQITSRLKQDGLSQLIKDADYIGSPLLKQSELRLHKVFILNDTLIAGGITNISPDFMKAVINRFMKLIE
ncbi:MAG: type II toxin-antitoxin system PemK/MazF family toxin [Chitinophagaceae bacterium]|nr:type II toxin-antitoxin system PemK/MazF family toxin [Chitinophagaceae bacterium]